MNEIQIYTDGSCSNAPGANPSLGGWGYVITDLSGRKLHEDSGYKEDTTISEMEWKAIHKAVHYATKKFKKKRINIISDSMYCVRSMNEWCHTWVEKSWKNSRKKEIAHKEIISDLYQKNKENNITYNHINSHSGNVWNDYADSLAKNWKDLV